MQGSMAKSGKKLLREGIDVRSLKNMVYLKVYVQCVKY